MNKEEFLKKARVKLKNHWGYDSFRNGQEEAISHIYDGKDTLVLFPTGGGKSLCYQVPATVFEGCTLVISPLVALMQDQVAQLNEKGVSATFINSTISGYESEQRLVNARNGMYDLLYCAPERLQSERFINELQNVPIDLVAVDEAHCISEWGHDFRPSYREIKSSLEVLDKKLKWVALTATATPEVKQDILDSLRFEDPQKVELPFSRDNLYWWVLKTNKKRETTTRAVMKASKKGDGLIYGGTRRNCEELAKHFSSLGIKSEAYHAGIPSQNRKSIQQRWIKGETPLVVATNAFGMGIDKPDCRYVVHDEMPYSIESYYQEAGRAGRDGKDSFPLLVFKESDYTKAKKRLTDNYPGYGELEHIYKILCDECNIAVGSEMDAAQRLDYLALEKRSTLKLRIIKAGLRLLNQLDVITLITQANPVVELQFLISSEVLADFKESCDNRDKAEFIDALERVFGPRSFYESHSLEVDFLTEKLNISKNSLVKGLNVLMNYDHIIAFRVLDDDTLIILNSARSAKLPLGKQRVEGHRDNLLRKLSFMKGYVQTVQCREQYLRNYFGDTDSKACGRCDNCKKSGIRKKDELNRALLISILEYLQEKPADLEGLELEFDQKKEILKHHLQYLIRESKVVGMENKPGFYTIR